MYEKGLPSNRTRVTLFTIRFPGEYLSPVLENLKKKFRPYHYLHVLQVNIAYSLTLISTPKKSHSNLPASPDHFLLKPRKEFQQALLLIGRA